MSAVQVGAWLSLLLAPVAGARLAGHAPGARRPALRLVLFAVSTGALVVLPLQAEGALVLAGVTGRITLWGPAAAAAAVLFYLRRARDGAGPEEGPRRRGEEENPAGSRLVPGPGAPRSVRAAWAVMGALYVLFAVERLLGFPMSWDSVLYHLPVAAGWLQTGSLALPPEASFHEALPASADLLAMLALGTGVPRLGELWNLLSLAAAIGGTLLLARAVARRGTGTDPTAALLVAGLPMVLFQTFSAYVDLFVAGYLAAGLGLAAHVWKRRGSPGPPAPLLVVALGLAAGLVAGAKPTGWPGAVLLVLIGTAAVAAAGARAGGSRWLRALVPAGVALGCVAFWLVRNALATGSPVYPVEVQLMGVTIFEGPGREAVNVSTYGSDVGHHLKYWLLLPWRERIAGYPYNPGHGLGPLFVTFVLPGVLWVAGRSLLRGAGSRGWSRRHRMRLALLAVAGLLWATWWFAVGPILRFGLPVLLLACAIAAPFVDAFRRAAPRWFGGLLLASVTLFAGVAALPKVQDLAHQAHHGEWSWGEYYHLPEAYLELPAGATVVNADVHGDHWNHFALLGADLRYRVVGYGEAAETLRRWGDAPPCPAFLVDRAPFDVDPDDPDLAALALELEVETRAGHRRTPWRIWRVTAGGCGDGAAGPP